MSVSKPAVGSGLADLRLLGSFLGRMGVGPKGIAPPIAMSLGAAGLEGLSVWLLVPLTQGLMTMDFSFLRTGPGVSRVLALLPPAISSDIGVFLGLSTLIFGVFLIKNALQYAGAIWMARLVRSAGDRLRSTLFERYMGYGKQFLDRSNAGHLQSVLIAYPDRISTRLIDLQQYFTHAFTLVAYLGMMLYLSWRLTLISAAVFPVLNAILNQIVRRIRGASAVFVERQEEMARRTANALSCMPLVHAYNMQGREHAAFVAVSGQVRDLELTMDKKLKLIQPLQETVVFALLLGLIAGSAIYGARSGSWRFSGILVFFYVIRRAATSFSLMGHMHAAVASVVGPMREVLDLVSEEGKFAVPSGTKQFVGLRSRVEFRALNYSYEPAKPVLRNISMTVEKGRLTAVVGASGGGKSTLISLLLRQYDCPPGAIFVDGVDLREFSSESLRERIALVSQDTQLLHGTLKDNIAYGLAETPTDERLMAVAEAAGLAEFLKRLPRGFDTLVGDRGVQLSGGEKQRVSIARAMLKGADILVLDEATSALDSQTERVIQVAIEEMTRGKTAIVIAHRLSTIRKADMIVVIEDGVSVEKGSLEELLALKRRFWRYWEDQKFY